MVYDKTKKKYNPDKAQNKSVEFLDLNLGGAPRNQHKQLKMKATKSKAGIISIISKSTAKLWKGASSNEFNTSTNVSIEAYYENIGPQHNWGNQVKKQQLESSTLTVWLKEHQAKNSKSIYREYLPKVAGYLHYIGRTNDQEFQEWVQNDILALNTEDGKSYYDKLSKDEYAAINAAQVFGCEDEWYYQVGEFQKEYFTTELRLQYTLNKHLWKNIDGSDGSPKDIYKDGRGKYFVNILSLPSEMDKRGGGLTQIKGNKFVNGLPRPWVYGYYNVTPDEQQEFLADGLNIPTDGRYCFTPEYLEICDAKWGKDPKQHEWYGGETLCSSFEEMYKCIFYKFSDKPKLPKTITNGVRSALQWSKWLAIEVILAHWNIDGNQKLVDQILHVQGKKRIRNPSHDFLLKFLGHYRMINYNETGIKDYDHFGFEIENETRDDNNNNNNSNTPLFNVETYKTELKATKYEDEIDYYTGVTEYKDNINSMPVKDYMEPKQLQHWKLLMKRDYDAGIQYMEELYEVEMKKEQERLSKRAPKTRRQNKKPKKEIDSSSESDSNNDENTSETKNHSQNKPQMRSISQMNAINDDAAMFPDDEPFATPTAPEPSKFVSESSNSPTPALSREEKLLKHWQYGQALQGAIISKHYYNEIEKKGILLKQQNEQLSLWSKTALLSAVNDQCFYGGDRVRFDDKREYQVIKQYKGQFNKETLQTNGGILVCAPVDDNNTPIFEMTMEFDLETEPVKQIEHRSTVGMMTPSLRIGHVLQVGKYKFTLSMVDHDLNEEELKGWETLVEYESHVGKLYFSINITPKEAQFMRVIGDVGHRVLVLRANPWWYYIHTPVRYHQIARNDIISFANEKFEVLDYLAETDEFKVQSLDSKQIREYKYDCLVNHEFELRPYCDELHTKYDVIQPPEPNPSRDETIRLFDISAKDGNYYRCENIDYRSFNKYIKPLIEQEITSVKQHEESGIKFTDVPEEDNNEIFMRLYCPYLNMVRTWKHAVEDEKHRGQGIPEYRSNKLYNFGDLKIIDNPDTVDAMYLAQRETYLLTLLSTITGKYKYSNLVPIKTYSLGYSPPLEQIKEVAKELKSSKRNSMSLSDSANEGEINVETQLNDENGNEKENDKDNEIQDDDIDMSTNSNKNNSSYIISQYQGTNVSRPKQIVWSPQVELYLQHHGVDFNKWNKLEKQWFCELGIAAPTFKVAERNGVMFHDINMEYEKVKHGMAHAEDIVKNSTEWIKYDQNRSSHIKKAVQYDKTKARIHNSGSAYYRVFDTSNVQTPRNVGSDHISEILTNNDNEDDDGIVLKRRSPPAPTSTNVTTKAETIVTDKELSKTVEFEDNNNQELANISINTSEKQRVQTSASSQASDDDRTITDKSPDIDTSSWDNTPPQSISDIKKCLWQTFSYLDIKNMLNETMSNVLMRDVFGSATSKECLLMCQFAWFEDSWGIDKKIEPIWSDPSITSELWKNDMVEPANIKKVAQWMVAQAMKYVLHTAATFHTSEVGSVDDVDEAVKTWKVCDTFDGYLKKLTKPGKLNKCLVYRNNYLVARKKVDFNYHIWDAPNVEGKIFVKCYDNGAWCMLNINGNTWDQPEETCEGRSAFCGIEGYLFKQDTSIGQVDSDSEYNKILKQLIDSADDIDDIDIGTLSKEEVERIKVSLDIGSCSNELIQHAKPMIDYQRAVERKKLFIPFKRARTELYHISNNQIQLQKLVVTGEKIVFGVFLRDWLDQFVSDPYVPNLPEAYQQFIIDICNHKLDASKIGLVSCSQKIVHYQNMYAQYHEELVLSKDKQKIANQSKEEDQVDVKKVKSTQNESENNNNNSNENKVNISPIHEIKQRASVAFAVANEQNEKKKDVILKNIVENVLNKDNKPESKHEIKQQVHKNESSKNEDKETSSSEDMSWQEKLLKLQQKVNKYSIALYDIPDDKIEEVTKLQDEILSPAHDKLDRLTVEAFRNLWHSVELNYKLRKIGQGDGQNDDMKAMLGDMGIESKSDDYYDNYEEDVDMDIETDVSNMIEDMGNVENDNVENVEHQNEVETNELSDMDLDDIDDLADVSIITNE